MERTELQAYKYFKQLWECEQVNWGKLKLAWLGRGFQETETSQKERGPSTSLSLSLIFLCI